MKRWIPFLRSDQVVSVVRLSGVIATGGRGSNLNEENISPILEKAFTKRRPKAVALLVNSPGGSPVQSSLIGAKIKYLSKKNKIPVYAFVEDVAASGGYWIACCADEIFVDESSIVGSIGVISASFGFNQLMERQGVERRVHTSGKDKSMLDPFRPERPDDVKRLKDLQSQIHENFISHVKLQRGSKLSNEEDLFSGEIWIGKNALEVGLVDGIGHLREILEEKLGNKIKINSFEPKKSIFHRFGTKILTDNIDQLQNRGLWARFGL